jgi:hypothetical protein
LDGLEEGKFGFVCAKLQSSDATSEMHEDHFAVNPCWWTGRSAASVFDSGRWTHLQIPVWFLLGYRNIMKSTQHVIAPMNVATRI